MNNAPEWLLEKGKINEPLFCREFCKQQPLICVNGKLYSYDGFFSDSIISHQISERIMPYVTTNVASMVKRLADTLKLCCFTENLPVKEDEINLLNGVLKTNGTWIPEKQFCINRLNVEYDPDIWNRTYYPEKFLLFLMDMLDMEDILTLQEYLGYCLIPSTRGQAAMFIIGNGGEGKNCIRNVLQEIFGSSMITAGFHRIETDRFFRANLSDKLLMVDDDMQLNALPSTGYIKSLITSDAPVDVEEKGVQSKQAELYCRFLCLGNGSPKALYDKSDGFSRRLIIVSTKPVSPNRINDPHLSDKLKKEKLQILCWMVDGLKRLLANDFKFTISEKTKKNIAEVMTDGCNIPEFLSDTSYITFGEDYSESSQVLYAAYADWCHKNLMTVLNQNTFCTWLRSNAGKWKLTATNHVLLDNGRKVRGYKGIKAHFRSILLE